MSTPDFTPEQQAYIDDLRNTLRGEFEATEQDPHARKSTVQELEDLKADALSALKHTLKFGDNESIKAKVAMWTVGTLLDAQKVGDDPLAKFLEGMTSSDKERERATSS